LRVSGTALFERICQLDLEGIVAKQKFGPLHHGARAQHLVQDFESGILQKDGREDLFERERHSEPVPGWHSCALACVEVDEVSG
jgi:hypothetical protein